MFSKKPKNKGKNKTAIVEIDISEAKVIHVEEISGVGNIKFKQLGHANDLTASGKYFHVPWYQTDGKSTQSNRIGYINKKMSEDAKSKAINRFDRNKKQSSLFGAARKNKYLALGVKVSKNNRFLSSFSFKKRKYKFKKKLFKIKNNKQFPTVQCMEYAGKK